jgi:phospholipase A2
MFGSAFTARVIRVYEEIRSFLPHTSTTKLDNVVGKYERSISKYHPISPLGFPNPFYGLAPDENKRTDSFISSKDICLIDAGVDNNIPFYPLLRQERDIDIIFAIDLSSDIQTTSHFDRAETYIKHRRMTGWPKGAGWPKQSGPSEKYPLGPCTIFSDNDGSDISLVYFPFIGNSSYDPDFDPQTEEFCKTWNFVYEPDQIHKLIGLADANWRESENQIRALLKETWERKMKKRQMIK